MGDGTRVPDGARVPDHAFSAMFRYFIFIPQMFYSPSILVFFASVLTHTLALPQQAIPLTPPQPPLPQNTITVQKTEQTTIQANPESQTSTQVKQEQVRNSNNATLDLVVSNNTELNQLKSNNKLGIILGSTLGGAALLGGTALAAFALRKKSKARQAQAAEAAADDYSTGGFPVKDASRNQPDTEPVKTETDPTATNAWILTEKNGKVVGTKQEFKYFATQTIGELEDVATIENRDDVLNEISHIKRLMRTLDQRPEQKQDVLDFAFDAVMSIREQFGI